MQLRVISEFTKWCLANSDGKGRKCQNDKNTSIFKKLKKSYVYSGFYLKCNLRSFDFKLLSKRKFKLNDSEEALELLQVIDGIMGFIRKV